MKQGLNIFSRSMFDFFSLPYYERRYFMRRENQQNDDSFEWRAVRFFVNDIRVDHASMRKYWAVKIYDRHEI